MVFTQQGLRLLAKVQAGAALAFTRVAVGDGYVALGQDPTTFTALVDQKMSLSINSIVVTDPQATICAVISNVGLGAGFYWREIGVFATDPNLGEILFGYDNAASEANFVPPASGSSFTAVCNIAILISNVASVTATINPYVPDHAITHVFGSDPIQNGLVPYAVDTGSANAYAVTFSPGPSAYTDGLALAVKIAHDSTGAVTISVNSLGARTILDSLGNAITPGGLKTGIIYTLRYNASTGNFIVQGKGGGGNATAAQLLAGQTATVDAGQITGTMPNNPSPAATITTQGGSVTVPAGDSPGGVIYAILANLAAAVIKTGVTVGGILGTFTADATATAAQILAGATAYVNGSKVTGTMPNKGAVVLTPSGTGTVAIPAGAHNGAGYVQQVAVPSIKVQNDTTIAGVTGTMPENGSPTLQPGASITPGHYTGGSVASAIKSIQYGTVTISTGSTSGTATLSTSVSTANAVVMFLGINCSADTTQIDSYSWAYLALTNGTTVTATRYSATYNLLINFVVLEFWPASVKTSTQQGTVHMSTTNLSGTATLTNAVNSSKYLLTWTGVSTGMTTEASTELATLALTAPTTITAARGYGDSDMVGETCGYNIIEFN